MCNVIVFADSGSQNVGRFAVALARDGFDLL